MEEELRALIRAIPSFSGVVVDWGDLPQGTSLPGAILNVVSDLSTQTQGGPSALSEARVQVDVYAVSYGAAKRLARDLRVALDGYKGGRFAGVFLSMVRDTQEGGETPDSRVFRCMTDFTVWYQFGA